MRKNRWSSVGLILAGAAALGFLVSSMPGTRQQGAENGTEGAEADPEAPAGVERFPFPEDQGGKLLEQRLPPGEQAADPTTRQPPERPRRAGPGATKIPDAPLPLIAPELPRPSAAPVRRPIRPHLLPEEPPLSRSLSGPVLPEHPELPAGAGIQFPSPPVDQPPPLPILSQARSNPTPLDDPTAAFSALMAISARMPDRVTPVPFLRLTLPDPFEHHREVSSGNRPMEESLPITTPRLPEK